MEVAGEEAHPEVGADERGDAVGEHLAVDAGPNRSGIFSMLVARITGVANWNENWMVSSCDSPRRIPATIVNARADLTPSNQGFHDGDGKFGQYSARIAQENLPFTEVNSENSST